MEYIYRALDHSKTFCGRQLDVLSFEDTYEIIYYQYKMTKIYVIDVFSKKNHNKVLHWVFFMWKEYLDFV